MFEWKDGGMPGPQGPKRRFMDAVKEDRKKRMWGPWSERPKGGTRHSWKCSDVLFF